MPVRLGLTAILVSIVSSVCGCNGGAAYGVNDLFSDRSLRELARAIQADRCPRIEESVRSGADPNGVGRDGIRPLFWALDRGKPEAFRCLLDLGADPAVRLADPKDAISCYSLMRFAAMNEDSFYLETALKFGADPNLPCDGSSPLHAAIAADRIRNVQLLVNHGADLNARYESSATPLLSAAARTRWEIVYLLLEAGADPAISNRRGYDLPGGLRVYVTEAMDPSTEPDEWLLRVVEALKAKGFLEPEESLEDWRTRRGGQ